MERARFIKDEIIEKDAHFSGLFLETQNSCIVLLSEKADKLGTLAVAVPRSKEYLGMPISSTVLGAKNTVLARVLAEYVTARMGKIALVSIYLDTVNEERAQSVFRELLKKIIPLEEHAKNEERIET